MNLYPPGQSSRSVIAEMLLDLLDNDLDADAAADAWLERRLHVVSGECIYGCRVCGIPEGAVKR